MKKITELKIHHFISFKTIFFLIFVFIESNSKEVTLTQIIPIGDKNFRILSFAINSKGVLTLEATEYPDSSSERTFFAINENGQFYFKDSEGNITPYFTFTISNQTWYSGSEEERVNCQNLFVELNEINNSEKNNTEYLLSICTNDGYFELYDLENKIILSQEKTINYLEYPIYLDSFGFLKQKSVSDKNYYFIGFVEYSTDLLFSAYFYLKKFYLQNYNNFQFENIMTGIECSARKMVSCFETKKGKIVCLYEDLKFSFRIIQYDEKIENLEVNVTLSNEKFENFDDYYILSIFYKCIHFKEEIGIFAFYNSTSDVYPNIIFKKFENANISNYNNISTLTLNQASLSSNNKLNDLIKINDKSLCFIGCSTDKTSLYIVIITLFQKEEQTHFRYFEVKFNNYNMKIYLDMQLTLYNKFITIAFSYCTQDSCDSNSDEHYSSLIIFNYPNSTDSSIDLISHLNITNENISNIYVNFSNFVNVENNLFGLIYKGIKIKNTSEEIKIYSKKLNKEISEETSLLEDEDIIISFLMLDNKILNNSYIIEYSPVYTEPEYELFNTYSMINVGTQYKEEFVKEDYIGKISKHTFQLEYNLSSLCENQSCSICYDDFPNKCIVCENDYIFNNGEKLCSNYTKNNDTNNNTKDDDNKTKNGNVTIFECSYEEIIDGKCINGEISDYQIISIYMNLEKLLLNNNYNKENTIIETKNVIYQISTLKDQKNNKHNISTIDLGECGNLLQKQENLTSVDELIIYKMDIKNVNLTQTYVQYEIFNPNTMQKVNLDICKDYKIIINFPVNINNKTETLFIDQIELGHNIFNANDTFYTDNCISFSTNGKDVLLSDRKKDIYESNSVVMCQIECELINYNLNSKKSECKCAVQKENEIVTSRDKIIFIGNFLISSFSDTFQFSNFLVMKCYKLFFSIKGIKNNIGYFLFLGFFLLLIIMFIIYAAVDRKKINQFIKIIIKQKSDLTELKNKSKSSIKTQRTLNSKSKNILKQTSINTRLKRALSSKNKCLLKKNTINNKLKRALSSKNNNLLNKDCKNNLKPHKSSSSKSNNNILKQCFTNNIKPAKSLSSKINYSLKESYTNNIKPVKSLSSKVRNISKQSSKNNLTSQKSHSSKSNNLSKQSSRSAKIFKNQNEPPKKTPINFGKKYCKSIDNNDKNQSSSNSFFINNQLIFKSENKDSKKMRQSNLRQNKINKFDERKEINKNKERRHKKEIIIKEDNNKILCNIKNPKIVPNLKRNNSKIILSTMNDLELNVLNYDKALKIDNRSYIQVYWSFLKRRQIILFTFIPTNDYNLTTLKLSLFILLFSLFFTVNCLFYTDSTMHGIYIGAIDIINRLPQIIYSSLISIAANIFLKLLSLSESKILKLKNTDNSKLFLEKTKKAQRNLKIMFIFFFVLSFILMGFFWYFIGCFCAVYKNTQKLLIYDTFISFGTSMIYPFIISIFPTIFRVRALRAKRKDKNCLFQFSKFLSMF